MTEVDKEVEFVLSFVTDELNELVNNVELEDDENEERREIIKDTIREAIKTYHKNIRGV